MRQQLHLSRHLDGRVWRYSNTASANRRHTHAELELNVITQGSGTYLLGSHRYQVRRGDLLWLFPAQEHVLFEQSADFRMWIAVFRSRAVKRVATAPSSQPLTAKELHREACRRLTQQNLNRLDHLLMELSEPAIRPDLLNAGLGYALLQAWQFYLGAGGVPVRDVHPAVERAARLIRDGSGSQSLETLAHEAGLSPARLSRLFKAQTRFTIVDFRNRERIQRFLDIYGTGQRQTMLNAALEAGFGSYPQFHRIFKRVIGCSPGRFRHNVL